MAPQEAVFDLPLPVPCAPWTCQYQICCRLGKKSASKPKLCSGANPQWCQSPVVHPPALSLSPQSEAMGLEN